MSATDSSAWPTERGYRSGIVLQFGQTRADLLQWALVTGDPLADAVVEEIHAGGREVRLQLDSGIRNGLSSLATPPPAVAALLAQTERMPAYVDRDLLEAGSAPFFTSPIPVHMVSLSAGALIRVYESPSIAKVLTTTGRLVDGADRRVRETGKWVASAMLPGGLRPGGVGYIATLQVRMLHAHMRHLARNRGFDESAYGAPINQVDLARTWMDFTVTSLTAEEQMGFGLTSRETAQMYRYWWLLAHLLGIDARLVEGISTNEQARTVDAMLQAVTGPLVAESSQLAAATLGSIKDLLHEALNLPEPIGEAGLHSLARRFHGPTIADELQIGDNKVADKVISVATGQIRDRRIALRRDPVAWQKALDKNVAAAKAEVGEAEATLYENEATS